MPDPQPTPTTPTYSPDIPFDGNTIQNAEVKTTGGLAQAYVALREANAPSDGASWSPPGVLGEDASAVARQAFHEHDLGQTALGIIKDMGANKSQAEKIQTAFYETFVHQHDEAGKAAEAMKPIITERFGGDENFAAFKTKMAEANPAMAAMLDNPQMYAFMTAFNEHSKPGSQTQVAGGGGGPAQTPPPTDAPTFSFTREKDGKQVTETVQVDYRDRKAVGNFLAEHAKFNGANHFYTHLRQLHNNWQAQQAAAKQQG